MRFHPRPSTARAGEAAEKSGGEAVLGTALAGNADVICTRDADFFTEEVRRFSPAQGIQILSDLELLRALRL